MLATANAPGETGAVSGGGSGVGGGAVGGPAADVRFDSVAVSSIASAGNGGSERFLMIDGKRGCEMRSNGPQPRLVASELRCGEGEAPMSAGGDDGRAASARPMRPGVGAA